MTPFASYTVLAMLEVAERLMIKMLVDREMIKQIFFMAEQYRRESHNAIGFYLGRGKTERKASINRAEKLLENSKAIIRMGSISGFLAARRMS